MGAPYNGFDFDDEKAYLAPSHTLLESIKRYFINHRKIMPSTANIYYQTTGAPTGKPILLIPGLCGQLIDWPKGLIDRLVSEGFYVIAMDNRDAGLSKRYIEHGDPTMADVMRRNVSPSHYTLIDMAKDAVELLDHLKIKKAHIVGMSMGGEIAQWMAIKYPGYVLSLICVISTSDADGLPPESKEIQILLKTGSNTLASKLAHDQQCIHPDLYNDKEREEAYIKRLERNAVPPSFIRHVIAKLKVKDLGRSELLKSLIIPTLVIQGECDPIFSLEHGLSLQSLIPYSRMVVIPKLGHVVLPYFCDEIAMHITKFVSLQPPACEVHP